MNTLIRFLGRVCLSAIFISGGYNTLTNPGERHKLLPNTGLPESELLVRINGATMIVGGVGLALGILTKLSALTLFGSLIPTTIAGHPFWKETEQAKKNSQMTQFLKNTGIAGGLLLILSQPNQPKEAKVNLEA